MIPAETCPQQKVIIRFSEMMHGKHFHCTNWKISHFNVIYSPYPCDLLSLFNTPPILKKKKKSNQNTLFQVLYNLKVVIRS